MRPDSKIDFNIDIAMKKGANLENVKKSVQDSKVLKYAIIKELWFQ